MPLAAELEVPSFDHTDAILHGPFGTPSGVYGVERLPLKLERSL